jgi:hypothetical protein
LKPVLKSEIRKDGMEKRRSCDSLGLDGAELNVVTNATKGIPTVSDGE